MRVTDLERTLADSIEDMDKISGIEETISMICQIRKIDEKNYVPILMSGIKISFIKRRAGCLRPMGMQEFRTASINFAGIISEKANGI